MKKVMRLKLITYVDFDEEVIVDFYLDVNEIIGFFIPGTETDKGKPIVNIYVKGGECFGLIQTENITGHLQEFIKQIV